MGQVITTCKQCKMKNEIPEMDVQREIKSEIIKKQRELLVDFESFALIKSTIHSVKFDGVFRIQVTISEKVIDSLGLVKPMDIEKLQAINEQSEIKHMIALQLGELVNIPLRTWNGEHITFHDGYTLVKSWALGEQMMNFEACTSISGIELVGLVRGEVSVYQKVIKEQWDTYKHIYLEKENFLDLYYDEQTLEFQTDTRLSAMLLYDGVLIYKKYTQDNIPDGEEVVQDVLGFIENGIRECRPYNVIPRESAITQQEYQNLKRVITTLKKQKLSRDVEITITKKTIYRREEKEVYYEQPKIYFQSSPKAASITDKLAVSVNKQNVNWDSKLLKAKIQEIIKEHKLNVNIALEKDIIIHIKKDICQVSVTPWEQGILMPYYQNSGYMSQFKQWIKASETIKFEFNQNPVLERINEMILRLFTQVPKVEKVINQPYQKICFVEKWKPPYEELENIKLEEIKRKSDKVLVVWLFDYENDDDVERLKELIKIKKANPQFELQIVILGYLKFETWTKLFFHFMQKHDLNKEVLDQTIETWFPQQEKFGEIYFSVLLYKMYGLLLDKKDMMIVDTQGFVRFIDNNRMVIPNMAQIIEKCNIKIKPSNLQNYNYWRQYQSFKKCVREHPQLKEITKKIQKGCIDESSEVRIEQKKDKIWIFENGLMKEEKLHEQPTRLIRNISDFTDINEMARIIAQYIDNRDIQALK